MDTLSSGFRSKIENGMNVRSSHRSNVGDSKFLAFQEDDDDDVFAIGKLEESASKNFSNVSKDFSLVFIEKKRAKGARSRGSRKFGGTFEPRLKATTKCLRACKASLPVTIRRLSTVYVYVSLKK